MCETLLLRNALSFSLWKTVACTHVELVRVSRLSCSLFIRTIRFIPLMSDSQKFYYAVAVGRKVGIYNTWSECKVQVENLQYAKFKKFVDLTQAKSFINYWANKKGSAYEKKEPDQGDGINSSTVQKENSRFNNEVNTTMGDITLGGINIKKEEPSDKMVSCELVLNKINKCEKKFDSCVSEISNILCGLNEIRNELAELKEICSNYISNEGTSSEFNDFKLIPKVDPSIASTSCQTIKSMTNAAEEAQKIIDEGLFAAEDFDLLEFTKSSVPVKRRRISSDNSVKESNSEDEWKESDSDEDFKLLPDCSKDIKDSWGKDGLNQNDLSFTIDKDGYVVVYTDGACKSNGKGFNVKAGIGIYFGEGNPLNLGRPLKGVPPSNSNAEIQAARIAMKIALKNNIKKLKIVTDSQYLLKSATEWLVMWKKNNWKRREKRPLKNKKELQKLDSLMSQLSVRWEKVLGHSGVLGNERADQLACKGAALYKNPEKRSSNM